MNAVALIGVHGAPRSGTSWLGQIFNSSEHVAYRFQPFFSYAFRGRVDAASSAEDVRRLFDDLRDTRDGFVTQQGSARLARSQPDFAKGALTHLVYKEVRFHNLIERIMSAVPGAKCVGLVRNPLSVLASWAAAPREFKPEWSLRDEWRTAASKNAGLAENWYGYTRWKELAQLFIELSRRDAERFRMLRYETLVADPETTVRSLFDFCGLPWGEQTARFIAQSTSLDDGDPYGVFRKHAAIADRTVLTPDIEHEIRLDLAGSELAAFLGPVAAPGAQTAQGIDP